MWTYGFFFFKNPFYLSNVHPNHFNFFVNFNIFHKTRSMCSKHSKNKNTSTLLDFEFVIMVQSKVINLFIRRLDVKKN
jgi:hypothetical protein